MIQMILVRHGRTAWNVSEGRDDLFRGTVDVPLAGEGVRQAEITARRLSAEPLSAIYASPLQRAARTAAILAAPHNLPVQTLPGLRSMDYGLWAGLSHAEVAERWPDLYRQWHANPHSVPIPGGDHPAELRARAVAAVHQILAQHNDGDTLVLVSHQVVTRTLVCALAGMPNPGYWWIRQDLCNLSRFDYDPASGQFTVVGLNDVCHLDTALPRTRSTGARLVLVRHGQTTWNAGAGEERFRGRTDLPLDETGLAQASAVAARLESEPIAAFYASPLTRARQTIAPLAEALDLPVQRHDGLLDIDYGRFQGLSHAEAAEAYPDLYRLWRTAPGQVHFPGGESLADVQARLLTLLDELAIRHAGETVVLVGHQIVNKVLACMLLGLDGSTGLTGTLDQIWRIQQDTAGIDVFQKAGDVWRTLCLNDTCHL
jgi:broad specificity phosphatase PhoE